MSVFLTSAKTVSANAAVIAERTVAQGLPSWLTAQLGNKLVAMPTSNLKCRVFVAAPREDGGYNLNVAFSGVTVNGELVAPTKDCKYNFQLSGWMIVYPASMEETGYTSVEDGAWAALEGLAEFCALKGEERKGATRPNVWFELTECDFAFIMPTLAEKKHYVRDAQGNKVADASDASGFAMGVHQEVSYAAAFIDASLCGHASGGSGVAISDEAKQGAIANYKAIVAKAKKAATAAKKAARGM